MEYVRKYGMEGLQTPIVVKDYSRRTLFVFALLAAIGFSFTNVETASFEAPIQVAVHSK